MACIPVKLEGGGRGIVCGVRVAKCRWCERPHTALCDWKMGGGKTCDAKCCAAHSVKPAAGKDLCPGHAKVWDEWKRRRMQ